MNHECKCLRQQHCICCRTSGLVITHSDGREDPIGVHVLACDPLDKLFRIHVWVLALIDVAANRHRHR